MIERTGTSFDDSAPVLVSGSYSRAVLDVGSADDTTYVTFRITDETGFSALQLSCSDFSAVGLNVDLNSSGVLTNVWDRGASASGLGQSEFSGSPQDFTLTAPLTFPFGSAPNRASCSVLLIDALGHTQRAAISGKLAVLRTPAGQPYSPNALTFQSDGPGTKSGTLTWEEPNELGSPALYAYVVQGSTDGGETWNDLTSGGSTTSTSIALSGLTPNKDYKFRVRGENGGTVGQDTAYMNLNWAVISIHTPGAVAPSAPKDLAILNIISSGVKLTFSGPDSNGGSSITQILVEVSRDGSNWTKVSADGALALSYELKGLAPATTYQVRVAASNAVGRSDYLTGSFTTLAALPTAPQGLVSDSVSINDLKLKWQLPASNGGSNILDYSIQYSTDGNTWKILEHSASNVLSFDVSKLKAATKYWFRVATVNSIGMSEYTTPIQVETLNVAPNAPSSLQFGLISATSGKVNFAAPVANGGSAITEITVEVSSDGVTWKKVSAAGSSSLSSTISGLKPGKTYQVRVSAVNSSGRSEYLTGSFTTLDTVPTAPASLSVSTKSTSVVLKWRASNPANGSAITNFVVQYSKDGKTWITVKKPVSTSLSLTVSGLKSKTKYWLRVSAVNGAGNSAPSKALTITTK